MAIPAAGHMASVMDASDPIRVMIVDDSAVIRGFITRWLLDDQSIQVVGSASNGLMALRQLQKFAPEVLVLDIEMPEMDGLTAIPHLLQSMPNLKIIMASTLTLRNADISMQALAAGAADYVPKPSTREVSASEEFRRELIAKIKTLGAALRKRQRPPQSAAHPYSHLHEPAISRRHDMAPIALKAAYGGPGGTAFTLRPQGAEKPEILAIGSSTGGPQALFQLFGQLKNQISLPILITQHMPPTFTTILAQHLSRISGALCGEAIQGEVIERGRIYIAPGDWHMTLAAEGGHHKIVLNQDPPENYCRPSVDPMLRSLARTFRGRTLVVMLTGMGSDGLRGSSDVVNAGGSVVAQDEASSVVWGMPGAVASGGLCCAVVPLNEIAANVMRIISGDSA